MSVSKRTLKLNRTQLSGSQKKNGLSTWRFTFSGLEKGTGQERRFFLELSMVNPALYPNEAVLGYKPRVNISAEDLQNVLAGSASAKSIQSESYVLPSYVTVRAGVLGSGAKQVSAYYAYKEVSVSSKSFCVSAENFSFDEEKLNGHIECSPGEVQEHPEYFCDSGMFSWNLRYEIRKDFPFGYEGKEVNWYPTGAKTVFAGTIVVDGKEYEVVPKKSCGYYDRFWGKISEFPWIHLSSNLLTSIISGKTLTDSAFAIQGLFGDRVSAVVDFEGKTFSFESDKGKRAYTSVWNFSQMPENDGVEKLHWSVSLHNKLYVVDIDVFCPASLMYVKSVELSEGNRRLLKVLSGGTGTGEIRLYKRIRKNLELIEHAHIASAICEYGQEELPEN